MSENSKSIVTPYAAAKVVNEALKEAGVTKVIPPQMMYNYTSARVAAGKNPFIAYTPETGVDTKSLAEWTAKYVAKQVALTTTAK
jgi:hypothetical protein